MKGFSEFVQGILKFVNVFSQVVYALSGFADAQPAFVPLSIYVNNRP